MAIHFQSDIKGFKLADKSALKTFLKTIFVSEGYKAGVINFRFCDDSEILEANKTYLQHDYYTDVITFPLGVVDRKLDADILISIDTVLSNSKKQGTEYNTELHRVIFHSILHLCGFGDKSVKEVKVMRGKEEEYLEKYFG